MIRKHNKTRSKNKVVHQSYLKRAKLGKRYAETWNNIDLNETEYYNRYSSRFNKSKPNSQQAHHRLDTLSEEDEVIDTLTHSHQETNNMLEEDPLVNETTNEPTESDDTISYAFAKPGEVTQIIDIILQDNNQTDNHNSSNNLSSNETNQKHNDKPSESLDEDSSYAPNNYYKSKLSKNNQLRDKSKRVKNPPNRLAYHELGGKPRPYQKK